MTDWRCGDWRVPHIGHEWETPVGDLVWCPGVDADDVDFVTPAAWGPVSDERVTELRHMVEAEKTRANLEAWDADARALVRHMAAAADWLDVAGTERAKAAAFDRYAEQARTWVDGKP